MDKLKQWCVTVSVVSVVSGVLMYLIPKGSGKNTYRVLVSLILLHTFIFPFTDFKGFSFDFSEFIPQSNNTASDTYEGELYVAQKTYEEYIESQLRQTVGEIECECICTYSEGELMLRSIIILTEVNSEAKEEILHKLESVTDENTSVFFRGNEDDSAGKSD